MDRAESKLQIVIPNWNGREMLALCLESLQRQTFQDFSVIVVDNGSQDGSVAMVHEHYPQVEVIVFETNTGFSRAVNAGIEAARAPWILLLNNDLEVAPDCLEQLVAATDKYPQYQFFALKMLGYHDRQVVDGAGDAVMRGGVGYKVGTMEQDAPCYQHDRECFGACAGAALYQSEFFEKVGIFDPAFFAYLEDVDLNFRARAQGLRCMYLAQAKVYHVGSATTGSKINELTVRLSTRNNLLVLAKNYPMSLMIRFFPAIIVFQLMWLAFCLKKKVLRPYLRGLREGLVQFSDTRRHSRNLRVNSWRLADDKFGLLISQAEVEAVESIMARRRMLGKGNALLQLYRRIFFLPRSLGPRVWS